MKGNKATVLPGERAALHAKLEEILSRGDTAEIILVVWLLLELRPISRRKASKNTGQPKRLPS
jgi:hypothetical protein